MVVDPGMPDEQLALRSSRGDREAFAELYARYFQGLYDLIFRMVRDPEMAADLVQNCYQPGVAPKRPYPATSGRGSTPLPETRHQRSAAKR
jgi:hypothetical protein